MNCNSSAKLLRNARVQDPNHYPPDYSAATYAWVTWLSWFGAASAYLARMRGKSMSEFSLFAFVCEIVVSSFVGLVTFYLCDWQGIDPRLGAVSIAISAHFSTRAIFLMRRQILGSDDE